MNENVPTVARPGPDEVKAMIKRWSEFGIDEAFTNADLKAQLVSLLADLDCPKWLAQLGVKTLTPVFLYLAKGANERLSERALTKAITYLLKVPGAGLFFSAMNKLEGKLIEKADAKRQFQALLRAQSPTAHDLNALLDPGLAGQLALLEQSAEVTEGLAELKALIESNANPQPLLELYLEPPSDTTRFVYRSRSIPFVDDGESLEALCAFRDSDAMFSWFAVLGSGGTGKSRLALEFLLDHADEFASAAGFLNLAYDPDFDWGRWQPNFPTLIVIDYAARQEDQLARILSLLSQRTDLDWPVRLLLLERQQDTRYERQSGSWYDRILHLGQTASIRIENAAFDRPMELLAPDDVWPIIDFIVDGRVTDLDPDTALPLLETIDPHMRPLYAAFMADALARGENPRGWDRRALVENVLAHERKNYWSPAGVTPKDLNLVALATMTAGYPLDWLEEHGSDKDATFLPRARETAFQHRLSAIYGYDVVEAVPPMEPDILGEVFVLEEWKAARRPLKRFFVKSGKELAPWFADFFSRLTEDFPNDVPDDFLKEVLGADFEDYEPTRSEMIYNTILDFVVPRPADALSLFELLLNVRLKDENATETLLTDQMEAAFNLMVGLPKDMIEERMQILESAHQHLSASDPDPRTRAKFCEALKAFVDSIPGLDVARFEPIAEDILELAKTTASGSFERIEALRALSAYIQAHDESEPEKAIHWYRQVEALCALSKDTDEVVAWEEAAYHNYLLYRLDDNHTLGTAFLEKLEDIGANFAQKLEDRFQQALDEAGDAE